MVGRIWLQGVLLLGIGASPWVLAHRDVARTSREVWTIPARARPRVEAAGAARVRGAVGDWRAAVPGEVLPLPVDVETGADGGFLHVVHRGARIDVGPSSRLTLGLVGDVWPIHLVRGRVDVNGRQRPVRTTAPVATWSGTRYALRVVDDRATSVHRAPLRIGRPPAPLRELEAPGAFVLSGDEVRRVPVPDDGLDGILASTHLAAPERAEADAANPPASAPPRPAPGRSRGTEDRATRGPEGPSPRAAGARRDRRAASASGSRAPASAADAREGGAPSRARRPTEPPERLEVDWTKPGRPDRNVLDAIKREAPAPGDD